VCKKNNSLYVTYLKIIFYLLQHIEEDGQSCTPLIIASRHGHEKVVKMILGNFKTVDIEQEGVVKFDGYMIEGASALWCAAGK